MHVLKIYIKLMFNRTARLQGRLSWTFPVGLWIPQPLLSSSPWRVCSGTRSWPGCQWAQGPAQSLLSRRWWGSSWPCISSQVCQAALRWRGSSPSCLPCASWGWGPLAGGEWSVDAGWEISEKGAETVEEGEEWEDRQQKREARHWMILKCLENLRLLMTERRLIETVQTLTLAHLYLNIFLFWL